MDETPKIQPLSQVDRINQKRDERISELADFGIVADHDGVGVAGSVRLTATNLERLLVLLRRQQRTIDSCVD